MHSFNALPNMASTIYGWSQPLIKKTVTIIRDDDFNDVPHVDRDDYFAVVQVANKEKLNLESLDWSKEYKLIHSAQDADIGQYIEYKGRDFKIVDRGDHSDYGYYELVGEETKEPLL